MASAPRGVTSGATSEVFLLVCASPPRPAPPPTPTPPRTLRQTGGGTGCPGSDCPGGRRTLRVGASPEGAPGSEGPGTAELPALHPRVRAG